MKYFFRQIQGVNMYKYGHGLFKIYVDGRFESTYYLQMQTVNYTPTLFHFPTLSLN